MGCLGDEAAASLMMDLVKACQGLYIPQSRFFFINLPDILLLARDAGRRLKLAAQAHGGLIAATLRVKIDGSRECA